MNCQFVSTTEIQRKPKNIFGRNGFNAVLKDNKVIGILFTGKGSEVLLNSDFLQEFREELYEVYDQETQEVIDNYRSGDRKNTVDFEEFIASENV